MSQAPVLPIFKTVDLFTVDRIFEKSHTLFSHLQENCQDSNLKEVTWVSDDGFQMSGFGQVEIDGKLYNLSRLNNCGYIIGHATLNGTLHLVVTRDPFVRFIKLESFGFSELNYYFMGGIKGIAHFVKKYPELESLLHLFDGSTPNKNLGKAS